MSIKLFVKPSSSTCSICSFQFRPILTKKIPIKKAADRAAKINSKLGAKPASSRPDPFFDHAKHEAMMGAEVTYAMPGGRYDKTKEGIANVPFTAQQGTVRTSTSKM